MIRLDHINISFGDKSVIENAALTLPKGQVVAITGPSGSGKTTLLYIIGLIASQTGHSYVFDGTQIDSENDREKAFYRRYRIGYVFQQNSLIDSMNVRENLLTSLSMVEKIQDKSRSRVDELLETIGLRDKADMYPRQLSGGERQRAAIACALIKNPDLIIADEPTSALDKQNADMVFDLLWKIAHEQHKMVVIATHDPDIYHRADVLYQITDRRVVLSGDLNNDLEMEKSESKEHKTNYSFGFYAHYINAKSRKNRLRNCLIVLFCALAVSFVSLCSDFGQNFVANQDYLMNRISDREIFVVNATNTNGEKQRTKAMFNPWDAPFDADAYRQIGKLTWIRNVVPYYEVWGQDINGKSISYYVVPYYGDQLMDQKSIILDETVSEEDGVYVSYLVAQELGLDDLDKTKLTLSLKVPTKLKNIEQGGISISLAVTQSDTINVSVRGILAGTFENSYSESGNMVIYVPYQQLSALLKENGTETFEENESAWAPSACWAVVGRYDEVESAKMAIRELDSNWLVYNRYQDFETMTTSIKETRIAMTIVSIAIVIIVFFMVTVVRIHETQQRKYEICILKANGATRVAVYRLIVVESVWEAVKIFVISLLFTVLLMILTNDILFHQQLILMNWKLFFMLFIVSVLSVTIPAVITVLFTNKYEPDKLMRN